MSEPVVIGTFECPSGYRIEINSELVLLDAEGRQHIQEIYYNDAGTVRLYAVIHNSKYDPDDGVELFKHTITSNGLNAVLMSNVVYPCSYTLQRWTRLLWARDYDWDVEWPHKED